MRTNKCQEIVKSVPIQIPANATGSLQLLVADATRLSVEDRRESRGAEAQRVSQLSRTFNKARRGNRLYLRHSPTDQGAIANGQQVTTLPPPVLDARATDATAGT